MQINLYNNLGFVRLVDHYGDDQRIVDAARVSYGSGTKKVRENEGLINYLMRHRHTSPFEMVDFTFHIKAPIYVMRQMIRHRTHSANEISGRYSVLTDECYIPNQLRIQSTTNKQGGSEIFSEEKNSAYQAAITNQLENTYNLYENMIEEGVSRELARAILPVATMTEYYWKQNLHNVFHFLKLRKDEHAQQEIRDLAYAMSDLVAEIVPITYDAWQNHNEHAITFSHDELNTISSRLHTGILQYPDSWSLGRIREFEEKATKAGFSILLDKKENL